ncbi:hypothetical protein [Mesorhizobium sp. KR1-2]|uniref:hypothetical protein n=1 Tax=Mesorhizobium sp. KR1-2 TaxID=3156609 RepID=UPI0032B5864A
MEMTLGFGSDQPLIFRNVDDPFSLIALNPKVADRVHGRLETAYGSARKIVLHNQNAIKYLAACLLVEETLEGPSLQSVVDKVRQCMSSGS